MIELLSQLGSVSSVKALQDLKAKRQVYSQVTRSMNCDDANLRKTLSAGDAQIAAIRRL